ncbi:MAG: oligopeptide:H+ symporter, partial [Flavobacteriales bacterium]|nr:oligopeptide:H+ symporter [Flavobacteriales bacterium]
MNTNIEDLFKDKVLGHPAGLFVLFFTEMWERFSFYGMRILLVLFLTAPFIGDNPGWEWPRENALALYGTYTSLLYLTPILGGIIADKLIGYRLSVVVGAIIMAFGHASIALETTSSMYIGLGLMIIGTGFFKPTITSIISEMYKSHPEKKDGAYTIFYMGVNAGAFFGIMLCGYLAETYGWSWGFGFAGIFMLLGMLQFWLGQDVFGDIGKKPTEELKEKQALEISKDQETVKPNPFTNLDKGLIIFSSIVGLLWLINDPLSKISGIDLFAFNIGPFAGSSFAIVMALIGFLILSIGRMVRFPHKVR